MKKVAVVLMNMGGPDSLDGVRGLLFNLFNDKAIIGLPDFLRAPVAGIISCFRENKAKGMYVKIGGKSPILKNTKCLVEKLDAVLKNESGVEYKLFIAMRYSYPFTEDAVNEVLEFNPDEVVLFPLYPQYSSVTTGSSIKRWHEVADGLGVNFAAREIKSFEEDSGYIEVLSETVIDVYRRAAEFGKPRVLFSAHGLPKKLVEAGDVYQAHCEKTVGAVVKRMGVCDLDYRLCYQSRVGFMKWTEPYTENEIKIAARDSVPVVMVPISFVSENVETLVENDIIYNELYKNSGGGKFFRAQTVGEKEGFMWFMKKLIVDHIYG